MLPFFPPRLRVQVGVKQWQDDECTVLLLCLKGADYLPLINNEMCVRARSGWKVERNAAVVRCCCAENLYVFEVEKDLRFEFSMLL